MGFLKSNLLVYTWFILSSLSIFHSAHSCAENDHCKVTTSTGLTTFRGVLNVSVLKPDVKFCSFLGIRYGQAPVNENRFGKPVAEKPKEGVYNATSDGNQCLQVANLQAVGDEDCLFLNVFVPKKSSKSQLIPVLVYIHGGAFFEGSSSSGEISPDYLIGHGIVMVTLNYRLNVFGFLNLDTPENGGNMGLRDQILALEWVQQNIKSFGGDPSRVTVMGQSAGAISVHLLIRSPLSKDLFHRAIVHSAISSVLAKTNVQSYSVKYAQHLGYVGSEDDHNKILKFLKGIDAKKLTLGFALFLFKLTQEDDTFYASSQPFWPTEDAHRSDSLLPRDWSGINIPLLAGQTDLDGTIAFYKSKVDNILKYVKNHLELYMKIYAKDKQVTTEVIEKVKKFYFQSNSSETELVSTIKLVQDFGFYKFYEQNFYRSNVVYSYQFCYDGSFQYYKKRYLTTKYIASAKGVSHTEDLNYLFYSKNFFPNLTLTPNDKKIIGEMSFWWTNFVKTGNPNSALPNEVEVLWLPSKPDKKYYLRINETSRLCDSEINEQRRQFWKSLPSQKNNR